MLTNADFPRRPDRSIILCDLFDRIYPPWSGFPEEPEVEGMITLIPHRGDYHRVLLDIEAHWPISSRQLAIVAVRLVRMGVRYD